MAFFAFFDADFACLPFGAWAFFPLGSGFAALPLGAGFAFFPSGAGFACLPLGAGLASLVFCSFFLSLCFACGFALEAFSPGFAFVFSSFLALSCFGFSSAFLACPLFPLFPRAFVLVPLRVLCAYRHLTNCVFSAHPSWHKI